MPDPMTLVEREIKLPRWAQQQLRDLRELVVHLERKVEPKLDPAGELGPRVFIDPVTQDEIPIAYEGENVNFYLTDRIDRQSDDCLTVRVTDGVLQIRGKSQLVAAPTGGVNVLVIKPVHHRWVEELGPADRRNRPA